MAAKFGMGVINTTPWEQEIAVKQSKINSAFFKIQRLDKCWNKVHALYERGDLVTAFHKLKEAWMELASDAGPEQVKNYDRLSHLVSEYYRRARLARTKEEKTFYSIKGNTLLEEMWVFLQAVENAQGLGKAYKDHKEEDIF